MSYNLTADEIKEKFQSFKLKPVQTEYIFNLAGLEKSLDKTKKTALMDDGLSPEQLITLIHRKNINHVIQNSLQPFTEKIEKLSLIEKDETTFFDETFTFFNQCKGKHKIMFDSNTPRETILSLAFHRLQLDIYATRSENLKRGLEEMIMNAQLDAKHLNGGKTDRKSYVILEKGDNLVAVSVVDHYGTLVYNKFLARIESCLSIGIAASINQRSQSGAGIGSVIIFNAADSLYLGCIPGQKTRVTAVIPYNVSEKNQEKLQKSIFLI